MVLWSCGLVVLLSSCYAVRAPLLRSAASLWVTTDPMANADAIVVLGGGLENRPFEAARLYQQHLAPKLLIMQARLSPTTKRGMIPSETELTRQLLAKAEVPEPAIVVVGHGVTSTYDESIAVRDWATTNGVRKIIVVTDPFHTRRARWLFRKELRHAGIQVLMDAAPLVDYPAAEWWHHENGIVAFQNEVLKSVYYHFKY